jgi:colicin import membrane protein
MKSIAVIALFLFGFLVSGVAQSSTKADDKASVTAQKKAEREKKKADKEAAQKNSEVKKSTGTNKDGTPDMRLKKNKDAARAAQTAPTPAPVVENPRPAQKVVPEVTSQPAVKSADRVVGTDDKGRTLYEGSRGGRYYINKNGNKEYVKKQ